MSRTRVLLLVTALGAATVRSEPAEIGCYCESYVCKETSGRTRLFCRFLPVADRGIFSLWEEKDPKADIENFDCENTRSRGNVCQRYVDAVAACDRVYKKLPRRTVGPVDRCAVTPRKKKEDATP